MAYRILKLSLLTLSLLFSLAIAANGQETSQIPNKKEISRHEQWTAILNNTDVTNPLCQINASVISPDLTYAGLMTVWRDNKSPQPADSVQAEIVLINTQTMDPVVLLDKDGAHHFGNESGVVKGVRRDPPDLNKVLFVVAADDFKKMMSPPNEIVIAILKDSKGKEIGVGVSVNGFLEAAEQCKLFE
jgi:invasion protein IalB